MPDTPAAEITDTTAPAEKETTAMPVAAPAKPKTATRKPKAKAAAKAPAAKPKTATEGIGVKELAASLDIEPRALRAFLRKTGRAAGRGTT